VRLGILGGTFDPPHIGHLLAAVDAVERLTLDRMVLVPASVQPLKAEAKVADATHRLAMTRLLVEGDDRFVVDPLEIERAGLSFSVDTLRTFAERYPADERFFVVGADVLRTFERWREPEEVLRLATLVVMARESADEASPAVVPGGARVIPSRRIDVSSTEIRARVLAGRSLRGFVPDSIAAYIAAHGLYR
jgi:nicotinate-nucleotide adenylyltransferase